MKKIKIILGFIIVGTFFVPCLPAMPRETNHMLLLETVREQRLNDLQNPVRIPQTTGLYHTYDEMTSLLFGLAANHSDIMSVSSIGKTYEGRGLWMVKLSDNVNQQEGEPEILFMGAHHGNEKSSYEVCLYFIQYMVEHYDNSSTPEVRESINATQIYVLPMVNPDGVEAGERKNHEPNHGFFGFRSQVTSYGVDLNRNYANHWFLLFLLPQRFIESTSWIDSSEVYRGPRPFSMKKHRQSNSSSMTITSKSQYPIIALENLCSILGDILQNHQRINPYLCPSGKTSRGSIIISRPNLSGCIRRLEIAVTGCMGPMGSLPLQSNLEQRMLPRTRIL